MTGVFAEFLAGYREAMTANALVDLDTLALEIIEPIRPWIDAYRDTPRFERHIHFGPIDFTIRIPPSGNLIRLSKLQAVFSRHTALTAASEQAHRQQAAEIEAENDLALAQGRAVRFNEAVLSAARAEAAAQVQRQLDEQHAVNAALLQQVDALVAETAALKEEIARLRALEKRCIDLEFKLTAAKAHSAEKRALERQVARLIQDREAHLHPAGGPTATVCPSFIAEPPAAARRRGIGAGILGLVVAAASLALVAIPARDTNIAPSPPAMRFVEPPDAGLKAPEPPRPPVSVSASEKQLATTLAAVQAKCKLPAEPLAFLAAFLRASGAPNNGNTQWEIQVQCGGGRAPGTGGERRRD